MVVAEALHQVKVNSYILTSIGPQSSIGIALTKRISALKEASLSCVPGIITSIIGDVAKMEPY